MRKLMSLYFMAIIDIILLQQSRLAVSMEAKYEKSKTSSRKSIINMFLQRNSNYESCGKESDIKKQQNPEKVLNTKKHRLNTNGRKVLDTIKNDTSTTDDKLSGEEIKMNMPAINRPSFIKSDNNLTDFKETTGAKANKTPKSKNNTTEPKYRRVQLPMVSKLTLGKTVDVVLPGDIEATVKVLSVSPLVIEVNNFIDEEECDLLLSIARAKSPKLLKNHLSPLELKTAQKMFNEWDYNEDGFITVDEVAILPGFSDIKFSGQDADDMFFVMKMDKNGDGKVDLNEMKKTDISKLNSYINNLKSEESLKRNTTLKGAWVWHDEDELLKFKDYDYFKDYHERISAVLDIPTEIIKESEPLQVKHFGEQQFQTLSQHSDRVERHAPCCLYGEKSACRNCRYISFSIFINNVAEGGELVFPMANNPFQNIMNNSGNWRGYYVYAKTTGNKFYFQADITFTREGANRIFTAQGKEDNGEFSFINGIIIDSVAKFEKKYNDNKGNDGSKIKYNGKVIDSTKISGNWWVPGNKRFRGTFFMWNRDYEIFSNRAMDASNHQANCTNASLVIKPAKGKAVFWYNHHIDPLDGMVGDLNEEAVSAQCEVLKGEKWIATSWINIIGDGDLELKAWRRGFNLLRGKSRDDILNLLGTNERKLSHEAYEKEYLDEQFGKNTTIKDSIPGYYKHKPPSNALQALNLLLNEMKSKELRLLADKVEKKLGLQCIPL